MKTTRLIFIALLSFMAAQCSTDEMQPDPDTDPGSGTVNLTLRSAATDTRTSLAGDGSVEWSPDDNVWVNGQMYFVLPDGNDPTKATVENVASAVDFLASFPDEPLMRDNGSYGVYIRENQTYSENSFGPSDNPMIAYSTSTDLQFRNIGGVVRIAVRGSQSVGNVAFIANDLNPAAGYLMIPAEDVQSGELADQYSDFDGADNGYERIYLGTGEPVTLSSSATTFDFVVAPRTYKGGFSVYVEDTEGNVAGHSTTGDFTVLRSTLNPMTAFDFEPLSEPEVSLSSATATSFEVTVSAPSGFPLKSAVVPAEEWDSWTFQDDNARSAILSSSYDAFSVGTGSHTFTADKCGVNTWDETVLSAATEYVVVTGYYLSDRIIGPLSIQRITTEDPSGTPPVISADLTPGTEYDRLLASISVENAVSATYAVMSESRYQYIRDDYQSDEEMLAVYGTMLSSDELSEALAGRLTIEYSDIYVLPSTEYRLVVSATSAGGMVSTLSSTAVTSEHIPSDAVWEEVPENVQMSLQCFGSGYEGPVRVEKMKGEPVFRFAFPLADDENFNICMNDVGYVKTDSEPRYIYVELRDFDGYSGEPFIAPGESYIGYTSQEGQAQAFMMSSYSFVSRSGEYSIRIEISFRLASFDSNGNMNDFIDGAILFEEFPLSILGTGGSMSGEDFTGGSDAEIPW